MTIIKPRSPSLELRVMSSLSLRMEFSKEEKERLYAIRKGYEGEVQFDKFYENCPSNWLVLNDLWLKNSNATFQIDSLLLTPQANYVFDIKNNEGEYELNDGRFYKNGSETRNNPLTQLQRCDTYYRNLLKQLCNVNFPVISTLTFVNPEYTLFGDIRDHPIKLPTQMKSFFEQLKKKSIGSGIEKPTQQQVNLANQILSVQLGESPYFSVPDYDYEGLRKGMICACCSGFLAAPVRNKQTIVCHQCEHIENVTSCILRSIEEFRMLFPDEKLTTDIIWKWCRVIDCKWRVIRVLRTNFKRIGSSSLAYYVDKSLD